jgi:hypothetical protein
MAEGSKTTCAVVVVTMQVEQVYPKKKALCGNK